MAAQAGRLTLVGNPQSARFNGPRFISVIKRILQYARVAEVAPGSVLQAWPHRWTRPRHRPWRSGCTSATAARCTGATI
jgi:hypothetical protein